MDRELLKILSYHVRHDSEQAKKYNNYGIKLNATGQLIRVLVGYATGEINEGYALFKLNTLAGGSLIIKSNNLRFLYGNQEFNVDMVDGKYPLVSKLSGLGNCHINCIKFAQMYPDFNGEIVVGEVHPYQQVSEEDQSILHVWLEKAGKVIDPTYNIALNASQYYQLLKVKSLTRLKTSDVVKDDDVLREGVKVPILMEYLMDHDNFVKNNPDFSKLPNKKFKLYYNPDDEMGEN